MRHLARFLLTVLAAGLLGTMLVRLAPAFGVSETELDPRFSRIQSQTTPQENVLVFYGRFLAGLAVGNLGKSESFDRPIADLLRERLPVSLRSLAAGAGVGLGLALGLAILVISFRSPTVGLVPVAASTFLVSIPSAALALLFLVIGWPPSLALAALVFPRVYQYAIAILKKSSEAPHIIAARARGLSPWRILRAHIVPVAAPQLLAVAGMAVSIAFPALVVIESVCDSPGVMQLALKAALARDLPLLVALTMVAAVVVLAGNAAADFSVDALKRQG